MINIKKRSFISSIVLIKWGCAGHSMNKAVELASMNNVVQPWYNNVVTTLFSHRYCNNLLTSWNRNVNDSSAMPVPLSIQNVPVSNRAMNNLVASTILLKLKDEQYCWSNGKWRCSRTITMLFTKHCLRYVYTLRLIGLISYLGACYIRTTVTKCIREKMTLYFRGWTIKSHSSGYEIGPINRSV